MDGSSSVPMSCGSVVPNRVFVGGLSPSISEMELHTYFEQHGKIKDVKIVQDRLTGKSKRFGFVTFENEACALKVLAQGVFIIKGTSVRIRKAIMRNRSQFKNSKFKHSNSEPSNTTNCENFEDSGVDANGDTTLNETLEIKNSNMLDRVDNESLMENNDPSLCYYPFLFFPPPVYYTYYDGYSYFYAPLRFIPY